MDISFIFGMFGFLLAAYSVIANDSAQTLGTFIASNKETKWLRVEQLATQKELINKISLALLSLNNGHPVKPIAAKFGNLCKNCSVRDVCRKNEWMHEKSTW